MNLQRISKGEYVIRDSGNVVRITKGLDNKWEIIPQRGLDIEPRQADSYADARKLGQWMMRQAQLEKPLEPQKIAAHIANARKASAAIMRAGDTDLLREQLAHKLRRMADDLEEMN